MGFVLPGVGALRREPPADRATSTLAASRLRRLTVSAGVLFPVGRLAGGVCGSKETTARGGRPCRYGARAGSQLNTAEPGKAEAANTHFPSTPWGCAVWGFTQRVTMDAALDEISRLQVLCSTRDDALDNLADFMIKHPEHDTDPDLTLARIALQ